MLCLQQLPPIIPQHTEFCMCPLPVLLQREMCAWLSDNITHPFPLQYLHLPVCEFVCLSGFCLSHRAIIQLQSQRRVAWSVIFDKLCWPPHLFSIWEPYTGILMDREETGSNFIYLYSTFQNMQPKVLQSKNKNRNRHNEKNPAELIIHFFCLFNQEGSL